MMKNSLKILHDFFRNYWLLVALSIIWGMAFVAIREVEPYLSFVNLTILRWFIASAGFLVLLPFLGKPRQKFDRRDTPRFLLVSFANVVVYHLTLNASESIITAGLAVLLVSIGPVFILILSWIFLGERHGRQILFAVALALTGGIVLAIGSDVSGGSNTIIGILEAIGTAISLSVFTVFSKPLVQKYGARPLVIWVGLAGSVMLIPFLTGNFLTQVENLPPVGWIAMIYLSVLSTVIGYMLYYTLISRGTVSRLSIQLYLVPVVGVTGGVLFQGDPVTAFTITGGVLLLLAVAVSTSRRFSKKENKKPILLRYQRNRELHVRK